MVTRCEVITMEPDELIALGIDHKREKASTIVLAEWITVVLQSFHPSCTRVTIAFAAPSKQGRAGQLRIYGETDAGTVHAVTPADGKAIIKFKCERDVAYSYSFAHVSLALRGLQAANKASLRIDNEGVLSIQCLIPVSASLIEEAGRGGKHVIEAGHLPIVDYLVSGRGGQAPKETFRSADRSAVLPI